MLKKALRWGTVVFAAYGVAVFAVKLVGKVKAKKAGEDPKAIKWVG